MKKSLLCAIFVSCVLLISCKPQLEVRFKSLPGEVPAQTKAGFDNHVPAPIVPAGGFVYIQTGLDDKAAVYGPYAVVPGSTLTVKDIPSGTYERLALFYTAEKLPVPENGSGIPSGLPLCAENDAQFWNLTASAPVSGDIFHDGGAASLFASTKLSSGRKTILSSSLVPLSATVFSTESESAPICGDTAGAVRKHFFRIDGGASKSLYVILSNNAHQGFLYAGTVALYAGNGSVIDTKTFNKKIAEDMPESVIFPIPSSGSCYLYVEYIAAGDTKLPLFFY